jgi:heptosyltransferase-2
VRVLVKEVNWLGDLVMSLPALRALRRSFAEAHLAVLVKRDLASFFDGFTWIDEVVPYTLSAGVGGLADRLRIVRDLRARHFDLAVLFPRSFDAALWPALAGIPKRVGVSADSRRFLLTKSVPQPQRHGRHQAHEYLDMLRGTLGIDGDVDDFGIDVSPAQRQRAVDWLSPRRRHPSAPLVGLAVAAAYGPAKEWPAERFAALIDLIASRSGGECVIVGAPDERTRCEAVAAASRSGALVAAGELSLGDSIGLLACCNAFAGNDSGAMHVAAALGVPTVGIFGSTDAIRTRPLGARVAIARHPLDCSPCLERTCRFGHYHCLWGVEAEQVFRALEALEAL